MMSGATKTRVPLLHKRTNLPGKGHGRCAPNLHRQKESRYRVALEVRADRPVIPEDEHVTCP